MALGFLLCLALFGSYYCGSMSPTMDSLNYAVLGGVIDNGKIGDSFAYVVIDKSTGKVLFSENIHKLTLGTTNEFGFEMKGNDRYW